MITLMKRFMVDETAATSIEYGLIAALIAVAIIGSITAVGMKLKAKFAVVSGNLS